MPRIPMQPANRTPLPGPVTVELVLWPGHVTLLAELEARVWWRPLHVLRLCVLSSMGGARFWTVPRHVTEMADVKRLDRRLPWLLITPPAPT